MNKLEDEFDAYFKPSPVRKWDFAKGFAVFGKTFAITWAKTTINPKNLFLPGAIFGLFKGIWEGGKAGWKTNRRAIHYTTHSVNHAFNKMAPSAIVGKKLWNSRQPSFGDLEKIFKESGEAKKVDGKKLVIVSNQEPFELSDTIKAIKQFQKSHPDVEVVHILNVAEDYKATGSPDSYIDAESAAYQHYKDGHPVVTHCKSGRGRGTTSNIGVICQGFLDGDEDIRECLKKHIETKDFEKLDKLKKSISSKDELNLFNKILLDGAHALVKSQRRGISFRGAKRQQREQILTRLLQRKGKLTENLINELKLPSTEQSHQQRFLNNLIRNPDKSPSAYAELVSYMSHMRNSKIEKHVLGFLKDVFLNPRRIIAREGLNFNNIIPSMAGQQEEDNIRAQVELFAKKINKRKYKKLRNHLHEFIDSALKEQPNNVFLVAMKKEIHKPSGLSSIARIRQSIGKPSKKKKPPTPQKTTKSTDLKHADLSPKEGPTKFKIRNR